MQQNLCKRKRIFLSSGTWEENSDKKHYWNKKERERERDSRLKGEYYQESVEYSKSFPLWEKIITATSASHNTEISWAFFKKPALRLEKVTWRLILFSILFSWTLPLPIVMNSCIWSVSLSLCHTQIIW